VSGNHDNGVTPHDIFLVVTTDVTTYTTAYDLNVYNPVWPSADQVTMYASPGSTITFNAWDSDSGPDDFAGSGTFTLDACIPTYPAICPQGMWAPQGSYQCQECPDGYRCDNTGGNSAETDTKNAC
jgi:hypothetical protein